MSNVDYWEQRIRSDVTAFVDPGTILEVDRIGAVLEARWIQRRKSVSVEFVVRDAEGVFARVRGREMSYRAFFASEDMGDVFGIAKTSIDIVGSGLYVDTQAVADSPAVEVGAAVDVISGLVKPSPEAEGLTNFVMVTGEAGAGKTSVLKELVRRQAQRFLVGKADYVYLYINAQGRALARFNEALATELNELRVWLPHSAVSVLVKLGLLVPIIDGFDELLGVGGYDDAFSSISSFVEDLDGKGAIVASARSTYYEQEFLSRASRNSSSTNASWKLTSVAVAGWGEEELRSYVTRKIGSGNAAVDDAVRGVSRFFSGANESLASKPLFVARATDFYLEGLLKPDEGFLLDKLVDAFVLREKKEKLLNKSGESILSSDQIKGLCSDIAEEMWNLGTRELDRASVRDLTELALCDATLTAAEKSIVQERTSNMAFLQPGEAMGAVCFEHEILFDYFLASRIASAVAQSGSSLSMLLGRSSMPDSLAESVANKLLSDGGEVVEIAAILSKAASKPAPRQQLVKENAGRLVGYVLRNFQGGIRSLSAENLVFPGSSLHGLLLVNAFLRECEFRRCDLTAARFENCRVEGALFDLPLVDSETSLGLDGIEPSGFVGLRQAGADGIRTVYEPRMVLEILSDLGLPSAETSEQAAIRQVPEAVHELVGKLVRAYAKCNPICVQDEYLSQIFASEYWSQLLKVGLEAGVLKEEARAANGPRRHFIRRLVRPEDLAAGAIKGANVPSAVVEFWDKLEEASRVS